MANATLIRLETSLVGRIVTQSVTAAALTIYAEFEDRKTGVAREPQADTNVFVLSKDTERFEMVLADSHSTAGGITTLTINANGRDLTRYGALAGSATGNEHPINSEIGCADIHIPTEEINKIWDGTLASGYNLLRIGDETDSDIYWYAQNGDVNKPYMKYDAATSAFVYANDGSSENPFGGAGALNAGDGIDITAGTISVDGGVQITTNDTNANYLNSKVAAGDGVTLTTLNPGGDEQMEIALDATTAGVDAHDIYTPAFLTGGNAAEGTFNNWLAVLDGEFNITIDGVLVSVVAPNDIDFTGVTSMNDVAAKIEAGIQAVSGGSETVAWSVDHFVITSGDTTSSSAMTVTSDAAGGGTDISGANGGGAADWMDCDTGNGVVTNAVRDDAADAGKLAQLDASGYLDAGFMPANLLAAAETGSTDITGTELETLSDGSNADSLHEHVNGLADAGQFTSTHASDASTTYDDQVIVTGFEPRFVKLRYWIQGHDSATSTNRYYKKAGTVMYESTTPITQEELQSGGNTSDGTAILTANAASGGTRVEPAPYGTAATPTAGDNSGTNSVRVTLDIKTIIATGFTIEVKFESDVASGINGRVYCGWEAYK